MPAAGGRNPFGFARGFGISADNAITPSRQAHTADGRRTAH
eukprot:COSAG05_NODE_20123_length_282_cov_4400.344262_1_plen_40_part_10